MFAHKYYSYLDTVKWFLNTQQGTNYTATCIRSRKLYKLDEPDTQDSAGEARTNSSVMYSYVPPHMAKQKQYDQLEHTYTSYVGIRDVALKTCQKRWMIVRSGERGSGISMLASRHSFIWTQLNSFKHHYLTLTIQFTHTSKYFKYC